MRWASALSVAVDPAAAASEAAEALRVDLGPGPMDLVVAFVGAPHVSGAEAIAETLKRRLEPGCFMGSSARGVIAGTREIESGLGLAVIAARLPGVELRPFVVVGDAWTQALEDPLEFARVAPSVPGAELVVFLGDPFSLEI